MLPKNLLILVCIKWLILAPKYKIREQKILENERMKTSMYFPKHRFVVEIDGKSHIDRNQNKENNRQTKIEKYPDCKFFLRFNPDAERFDIFLEISKIQNYITQ